MGDLKKYTQWLKGFFRKDLRLKIIVALGLAGMLLILISQFAGRDEAPADTDGASGAEAMDDADAYASQLEEKLRLLVTQIDGVGAAKVMVTLENSGESIYVVEEHRNLDRNVEPGAGGVGELVNSRENIQQSYIMVETGYGQKEPLLRTRLGPRVQGVVIICEGADDILVRQSLTNVVTTSLNIPTTRVCIEKLAPG